jgi:hypothetical protein
MVRAEVGQGRFRAFFEVGTVGGTLFWHFPGPDRRYNGGGASIHTSEMDAFVSALDNAWARYQGLSAMADGVTLQRHIQIDKWVFGLATGGYTAGVVPFSNHDFSYAIALQDEIDLYSLKTVVQDAQSLLPRLVAIAVAEYALDT